MASPAHRRHSGIFRLGFVLTGPLRGLRIAAVPYLNAKPLVHGLAGIRLGVPSQLARALAQDECDLVAALSIGAVVHHPEWRVLPSLGVAADGPVRTVMLLHEAPLETIRDLAFDPASRTSNLLATWLIRNATGIPPRVDPHSVNHVIIGDPAFAHAPTEGTDLALAWRKATGLPFVFAGWVAGAKLARDTVRLEEIDAFLVERHPSAMERLDDIANEQSVVDFQTARTYLRENILYRLDPQFRQGADRFAREIGTMGEGTGTVPWAC